MPNVFFFFFYPRLTFSVLHRVQKSCWTTTAWQIYLRHFLQCGVSARTEIPRRTTRLVSSPTMTPPRNPDRNPEDSRVPGKRFPFWLRQSDHHPMVESQPGEIIRGMPAFVESLRRVCSPSPNPGEFSRFSLWPATPDTAVHSAPYQHPMYSYPPPPPLPRPLPAFTPPTRRRAPHTSLQVPPPSSGSSRDQRGKYKVCFTMLTNRFTKTESPNVSIAFPVDSDTIGVPTTIRVCSWDTRKSFSEFWVEMCKNMRLDQTVAVLGYKFSGDRVKDSPRQLSTAEDYKLAMDEIRRRVRNARTKEHKLVLHNLVSPSFSSASHHDRPRWFVAPNTIHRRVKEKVWWRKQPVRSTVSRFLLQATTTQTALQISSQTLSRAHERVGARTRRT